MNIDPQTRQWLDQWLIDVNDEPNGELTALILRGFVDLVELVPPSELDRVQDIISFILMGMVALKQEGAL